MLDSNPNSVEKSDQQVMKHVCKLCDKSFSCGRSLGGHMRSHVINSTDHDPRRKMKMKITSLNNDAMNNKTEEVINGSSNSNDLCYELRKDPKKTLKAKDSNEAINDDCLVVLDKICKECGKGFQSWKALFGHMKCHSDKVSNSKTAILKQGSWISEPGNENSGAKSRQMKKSRSRNGTTKKSLVTCATTPTLTTTTTTTTTTGSSSISMNANHPSTSFVSDIDQDQETEVAMCLIMLSRDVGKWGKKVTGNGYKMKKIVETEVDFDRLGKTIVNRDEFDDQSNGKFECTTCNKTFHTYQALGGHKASHKKLKGCLDAETEDKNSIKDEPMLGTDSTINGHCEKTFDNHILTSSFNLGSSSKNTMVLGVGGAHECSICFKKISSGQALGGHKRSHLIAEAKLSQQNPNLIEKFDKPVQELRGFLDLNMPPDSDDEEQQEAMMTNTSTTGTGYNPWYYNHESTLLGLLSTG